MKKYRILYILFIVISIVMIITKGVQVNTLIHSYNDASKGIVDGFQGEILLSIYNLIIISIILISSIVMTLIKNNKYKMKWELLGVIIILSLLIPVGTYSYSGGIAGIRGEENIYIWNLITYLIR